MKNKKKEEIHASPLFLHIPPFYAPAPMGTGGSFLAGPWPNLIGYQHGQCARQYGL